MTPLSRHIEAVLFLSGKPVSITELGKILGKDKKAVNEALKELEEELKESGLRLLKKGGEAMLGTSEESSQYCELFLKEEVNRSLGHAGLETLSIMLYSGKEKDGGVSRNDIDEIRGVNSAFTLRNLLIRGLIERKQDPKNKRVYLYAPALKLFQYLGITGENDLPNYNNYREKIDNVIKYYKGN